MYIYRCRSGFAMFISESDCKLETEDTGEGGSAFVLEKELGALVGHGKAKEAALKAAADQCPPP